jgi:hypothetical protein
MFSGNRPTNRSNSRSRTVGPTGMSADRRSRRRLRELCDEVLASYRVASGQDLFNDGDRADARSMLSKLIAQPLHR